MVALLPWPAELPKAADYSFRLRPRTQIFEGDMTAIVRTEEIDTPIWVGTLTFPPLDSEQRDAFDVFAARLKGPAGRFLYGHPRYLARGPKGTAQGAPVIDGNGQTGNVLLIKGLTPNQPVALGFADFLAYALPGDNQELYRAVAPAAADATGRATVNIAPPIRNSPSDNEPVIIAGAACVMRFASDDEGEIQVDVDDFGQLTLQLVEAPQPLT